MAEKIYFTSLKGGTGVTTCAAGIALALAAAGERTLLLDGDREASCALDAVGCSGLATYTLADVEKGACRAKQAVISHPRSPNLYIFPTQGCQNVLSADAALKQIEGTFDYVVCDKCAGSCCDRAIVVCEPYALSVKSADRCLSALKDGGFKRVELIVNKVNGGLIMSGEIMTPQEIAALLRCGLSAVIPEDLEIPLGRMKSASVKAFKIAAQKISGKGDKIYGVIKQYLGVGGFIRRKMRNRL